MINYTFTSAYAPLLHYRLVCARCGRKCQVRSYHGDGQYDDYADCAHCGLTWRVGLPPQDAPVFLYARPYPPDGGKDAKGTGERPPDRAETAPVAATGTNRATTPAERPEQAESALDTPVRQPTPTLLLAKGWRKVEHPGGWLALQATSYRERAWVDGTLYLPPTSVAPGTPTSRTITALVAEPRGVTFELSNGRSWRQGTHQGLTIYASPHGQYAALFQGEDDWIATMATRYAAPIPLPTPPTSPAQLPNFLPYPVEWLEDWARYWPDWAGGTLHVRSHDTQVATTAYFLRNGLPCFVDTSGAVWEIAKTLWVATDPGKGLPGEHRCYLYSATYDWLATVSKPGSTAPRGPDLTPDQVIARAEDNYRNPPVPATGTRTSPTPSVAPEQAESGPSGGVLHQAAARMLTDPAKLVAGGWQHQANPRAWLAGLATSSRRPEWVGGTITYYPNGQLSGTEMKQRPIKNITMEGDRHWWINFGDGSGYYTDLSQDLEVYTNPTETYACLYRDGQWHATITKPTGDQPPDGWHELPMPIMYLQGLAEHPGPWVGGPVAFPAGDGELGTITALTMPNGWRLRVALAHPHRTAIAIDIQQADVWLSPGDDSAWVRHSGTGAWIATLTQHHQPGTDHYAKGGYINDPAISIKVSTPGAPPANPAGEGNL